MTVFAAASGGLAAGSELALATRGLTKRYGARPAVAGLDLRVPRGVVYGFLGPNGSGKTTTLRLLVGLLRPDGGTIELLGRPYSWRDRRRLFQVGSLIEAPAFYPYLSGRDNLRVIGATGAPVPAGQIEGVLEQVGLRDRAGDPVKAYSLGMKQRLGIAAALLSDPQLLLLDEPANGLDPAGIVAMRDLLRRLTGAGKTVVVSSHILHEVQQLVDIVGIIDRGRLVREGPLAALLEETGHVRVRVQPAEMPAAAAVLAPLAGGRPLIGVDAGPNAGWFTVPIPGGGARDINRALAERGIFASALEAGSDLETRFLELTMAGPAVGAGGPGLPPAGDPVATPPA